MSDNPKSSNIVDSTQSVVTWKHIGLHGHSVGTFRCFPDRIVWKSAITGRDDDDDDDRNRDENDPDDLHVGAFATVRAIPTARVETALWTVFGRSGHLRIVLQNPKSSATEKKSQSNLPHELRFDGFPASDYDLLKDTLQRHCQPALPLKIHPLSAAGTQYGLATVKGKNLVFRHCVLDEMNEEGQEFEPRAEDEMMSLNLAEVSQCVLPGNNRNEIEVQFPESDTVEAGTDQLVSIRFYIPPDPDADPADKEAPTAAEALQTKIMSTANVRKTTGDVIVSFEQQKGTFLTPRGRYAVELYEYFLRLRGQKYDYKIKYDDINRLFLLPKPDEVHMAFVIALDKPIRQGQQRYQYLVLQASKEPDEVTVNLDEQTLQKEYEGELQPIMRGSLSNLIAKTFKVIARKKVYIPGKFSNASEQACVKCAVRANEGLLYPLEKQFVFIHKPPILIRFNEVESVEFQRYAGGQGSTRNFDLCVNLKPSAGLQGTTTASAVREYIFSGIDRSDYAGLYNFLSGKKIPIKNLEGSTTTGSSAMTAAALSFVDETAAAAPGRGKPVYNEREIFGAPADGEDDEEEASEDEDYGSDAAAKDEEPDSDESGSGVDDDEMGSEVDDELVSDLEEHGKKKAPGKGGGSGKQGAAATKSKERKRPREQDNDEEDDDEDDDDDDDDDDNEKPKKKAKTTKKKKKDPNAPKRAMSAYMFYVNTNRDKVKGKNPSMSFGDIGKELGSQWKSLSADEKRRYEKMAEEDKTRYAKAMKSYTPVDDDEDDDDDDGRKQGRGKKKAGNNAKKKDPNAPKRALTSFMYFSNEMRNKIKEDDPTLSFGEVGKRVGEMFRALSSEEKEKYEKLAKKDKERYKKAMNEYKSSSRQASNDDDDSDGLNEDDDEDNSSEEDDD